MPTDPKPPNAHEESGRPAIAAIRPIIGLEVHVELRCATKVFSVATNPAHTLASDPAANTLTDPVILALPGALPRLNRAALELSVIVGASLGCAIAEEPKWDRKSYVYPDLPKGYQISQLDRPICGPGAVELPAINEAGAIDWTTPGRTIRIERAHLEEDAGKLLHDAPGGGALDGSIIDFNRAGAPLLEVVTAPDFMSAAEVVAYCRLLRWACRAANASHGILERGHMRFEPNINCELALADGSSVRTPIAEVKNLNSFRAVEAAIEYELREQPKRWLRDGAVFGPGTKRTYGWDDHRGVTLEQRAKEDADDYRYFPDPDLPEGRLDPDDIATLSSRAPAFPTLTIRRLVTGDGLSEAEALALIEHPADLAIFDEATQACAQSGGDADHQAIARSIANLMAQHGARLAKSHSDDGSIAGLGLTAATTASIARLRLDGSLSAGNAGLLMEQIVNAGGACDNVAAAAESAGWLTVRDEGQLQAWCDEALAAHPEIAAQVRDGKMQAIGRLIGAVMAASGGAADAKDVRTYLLERINAGG